VHKFRALSGTLNRIISFLPDGSGMPAAMVPPSNCPAASSGSILAEREGGRGAMSGEHDRDQTPCAMRRQSRCAEMARYRLAAP
jgi:hypothetical protein